jgi:hypothetical protein
VKDVKAHEKDMKEGRKEGMTILRRSIFNRCER